jgi:beta-galactosidase
MSGADMSKGNYLPDTTSYDYGAPLDESGRPTPKYFEFRKIIAKYTTCAAGTGEQCLPPVPAVAPPIAIPSVTLSESTSLWDNLPKPVASATPLPMESPAIGQSFGYILYRTQLPAAVTGDLVLFELHDYAQVYLDGKLVGALDRRLKQSTLPIATAGPARLDILVEDTARINYSKAIRTEEKGITQSVTLAGQQVTGWQIYSLPMTAPPSVKGKNQRSAGAAEDASVSAPGFQRATFALASTGDTFLDVRALGKGVVWVNGHNLGRFWNVGPQDTLYLPGPWLKQGQNEIVVFDLKPTAASPSVAGLDHPILNAAVADQSGNRKQE